MKWIIAILLSILIIVPFLAIPVRIHPSWEVSQKIGACLKAQRFLNEVGARILIREIGSGDVKIVRKCKSNSLMEEISYCLFVPKVSGGLFVKGIGGGG
ncbi:MAG: hypothetical protein DRN78_03830 [Thermoproteota archaeon]|nr:MAG: hypothetical protein DRN78_03830 [Candidatus Korarchaeota archaeon]